MEIYHRLFIATARMVLSRKLLCVSVPMSIYFECVLSSRYAVIQEGPLEAIPLTLNPEIPCGGCMLERDLLEWSLVLGLLLPLHFSNRLHVTVIKKQSMIAKQRSSHFILCLDFHSSVQIKQSDIQLLTYSNHKALFYHILLCISIKILYKPL